MEKNFKAKQGVNLKNAFTVNAAISRTSGYFHILKSMLSEQPLTEALKAFRTERLDDRQKGRCFGLDCVLSGIYCCSLVPKPGHQDLT